MSIWVKIGEAVEATGGRVASLMGWLVGLTAGIGDPRLRREVAFSVAMIALSAKMAKADGVVTSEEVAAFRALFSVPAGQEPAVTRLFDVAKRDVAGFRTYATRVASLYKDDRQGLEDVIDGLFSIAKADGAVHEAELAYLEDVATIFGFDAPDFERISLRHIVPLEGDPYVILGVERAWPTERIRARYRALAAENHPDSLIARGVPVDFVAVATDRMAVINGAYDRIERERKVGHRPEVGA